MHCYLMGGLSIKSRSYNNLTPSLLKQKRLYIFQRRIEVAHTQPFLHITALMPEMFKVCDEIVQHKLLPN